MNYRGSSLIAKEKILDSNTIGMELKIHVLECKDICEIYDKIMDYFVRPYMEDFFMDCRYNEHGIKADKIFHLQGKKLVDLQEDEELSITINGSYKDKEFQKCRSFNGLEKYRQWREGYCSSVGPNWKKVRKGATSQEVLKEVKRRLNIQKPISFSL